MADRRMPPAWPAFLALLAALAGCAAPGASPADGPADDPSPTGSAPQAVSWSNFTVEYGGTRLYRLPGDEPPASAWLGDPPSFCFLVPEGTRRVTWELTWDPAQEMRLEVFGPRGIHVANPPAQAGAVALQGPLALGYEDPPAGEWYAYAGPTAASGPVNWALRSEWSVAAVGVGPDQTFTDKRCY